MTKTKIAYTFPGQGAQWVGMGHDLYHTYSAAKAVFEMANEAVGFSLSKLCFEGPESKLRQTINAQPAVLVTSIACLRAAEEAKGDLFPLPNFVAGHSLGEYTALIAAGVIDTPKAVRLVRERGRLMHQVGQLNSGSMVAVIGLDQVSLAKICQDTGVEIANINCPGQIAISGTEKALAQAVDLAKTRGARRTIALDVSGAFHSSLMKSVLPELSQFIASYTFVDPVIPLVANTSAQPLTKAEAVKAELIRQLCCCVQWQDSVQYMINAGVSTFVEIGPGQVLSGLIKRINKEVQAVNIGDVPTIKALKVTQQ